MRKINKKESDKRIHVSFDDTTREILALISKNENRSMSEVVRSMVEKWMDKYEDRYWCEIAAQEICEKTIPIEKVRASV